MGPVTRSPAEGHGADETGMRTHPEDPERLETGSIVDGAPRLHHEASRPIEAAFALAPGIRHPRAQYGPRFGSWPWPVSPIFSRW